LDFQDAILMLPELRSELVGLTAAEEEKRAKLQAKIKVLEERKKAWMDKQFGDGGEIV
jgi:hypothetical protein